MKNKFMLVALIGVILVGALVMVSCGLGCIGDGNCTLDPDKDITKQSYCGSSIKDTKDLEKAQECKVYKNGLGTPLKWIADPKKLTCDC